MPLVLGVLILLLIQPNLSFDLNVFDQNVDSILKEVIGHSNLEAERSRWTTSKRMKELRDRPIYTTETRKPRRTTTTKKKARTTKAPGARPPSIKELKHMIKIREAENILNDPRVGLPKLSEVDDSRLVTKMFDEIKSKKYNISRAAAAEQKKSIFKKDSRRYQSKLATRLAEIDGRRQRYSKKTIIKHNLMRNRTLTIMEHFIYAVRYKLVHSQMLRKKYWIMVKYKIGFLFALMRRLKAEQLILFSTLSHYRLLMYTLDFHLRIYEKIVRLDVDLKDVMRLIQVLNRERQLEQDPNYLELYYEDSSEKPPDYVEQNRKDRKEGRPKEEDEPPKGPEGDTAGGPPVAPKPPEPPAPAPEKTPEAAPAGLIL